MQQADLERISQIRDYCTAIRATIDRYGNSFRIFASDPDYQRSISFSIMQIGEISGRLSDTFRSATAKEIQWGPMKGMRNLVAHSYGSMSYDIIWETAINDIPILLLFCERILTENPLSE